MNHSRKPPGNRGHNLKIGISRKAGVQICRLARKSPLANPPASPYVTGTENLNVFFVGHFSELKFQWRDTKFIPEWDKPSFSLRSHFVLTLFSLRSHFLISRLLILRSFENFSRIFRCNAIFPINQLADSQFSLVLFNFFTLRPISNMGSQSRCYRPIIETKTLQSTYSNIDGLIVMRCCGRFGFEVLESVTPFY